MTFCRICDKPTIQHQETEMRQCLEALATKCNGVRMSLNTHNDEVYSEAFILLNKTEELL